MCSYSVDLAHNVSYGSAASCAFNKVRGMFEMNCLLPYISISTWGTIKNNIYPSRFIQGLHKGV